MASYGILPAPVSFHKPPSGQSGYWPAWSDVTSIVDPSLVTNWLYGNAASSALSQASAYSTPVPSHDSYTYTAPSPQSTSYKPTYSRAAVPPSVTNSTRSTQSSATSKTFEGILQIQPVKRAETVSTYNRDDYDLPPIGPPVRKRLLKKSQPASIPTAAISAPSNARSRSKTHTSRYRWFMTPHERSVRDRAESQYYAAVNEMRYNVVKTALECSGSSFAKAVHCVDRLQSAYPAYAHFSGEIEIGMFELKVDRPARNFVSV